jgi:hemerythrin
MTFLSWREDYQVGLPLIDAEHRYIFALINDFHDEYASGRPQRRILRVLNRLVAYAEDHFQHEEALMRKCGYPRLAQQQKQHEKLYSSIYALNEKLSVNSARIDAETLQFLKHWMLEHIVKEDVDIGDFVRRKAAGAEKARLEQHNKPKRADVATAGEASTDEKEPLDANAPEVRATPRESTAAVAPAA